MEPCARNHGQKPKILLIMGLPSWLSDKESAASAGDTGDVGSIPGSGRSPRGGNDNPLQYSCLGNPMDRGAWWATVHGVAKSQTGLRNCACTYCLLYHNSLCPFSFLSSHRTKAPSPLGVGQGDLMLQVHQLWEEVMCFASRLRQ